MRVRTCPDLFKPYLVCTWNDPEFLSLFFPCWWLFVRRLMNLMRNVFSVDRRGLFELVWADFSASFSRISRVRVRVNEDFLPRPRLNGASVDGLVLQPADLLRECTSRRSHSSSSWSRCRSSYCGVVPPMCTSAGTCRSLSYPEILSRPCAWHSDGLHRRRSEASTHDHTNECRVERCPRARDRICNKHRLLLSLCFRARISFPRLQLTCFANQPRLVIHVSFARHNRRVSESRHPFSQSRCTLILKKQTL